MMLDVRDVPAGVMRLAEECGFERGHTLQVTRLALLLFDRLSSLHRLPPSARRLLACAGMLHDIGWCRGAKGHHKSAYDIITGRPPDELSPDEVQMVALIARYHRKKGPSLEHPPFARLSPPERDTVRALSAILRVADGLDRGHRDAVQDLSVIIEPGRVLLNLEAPGGAELEIWGALRKADVFEKVFGVSLDIRTTPEAHPQER